MSELVGHWSKLTALLEKELGNFDSLSGVEFDLGKSEALISRLNQELGKTGQESSLVAAVGPLCARCTAQLAVLLIVGKRCLSRGIDVATKSGQQAQSHVKVDLLGRVYALAALVEDCLRFGPALDSDPADRGLLLIAEAKELVNALDFQFVDNWGPSLAGKVRKVLDFDAASKS